MVVLGAGESGVGAALLAKAQGIPVFVSDRGEIAAHYRDELDAADIPYESGAHSEAVILQAGEVVKSPGIPDKAPLVKALMEQGTPVISEIEFAARYTSALLIGITGSNGKTTTATLTHHLLKTAGMDAILAGNVGDGFARSVAVDRPAIYVLELSSFQLDGIRTFRSPIAALLNITPDHLDRYDYQLEKYADAKFRIAENQLDEDIFVYFAEDENIASGFGRHEIAARRAAVSLADIKGEEIEVDAHTYSLANTALRGKHNALNAMFAIRLALAAGADPQTLQQGLDTFVPVPHRLEKVGELNGAEYINDSKATNVDAVFYALEAMKKPVVWIAGGQDKGNEYGVLLPLVREKVRALVCLGIDNAKLREVFAGEVEAFEETQSAADAVAAAHRLAQPGEVVLLSPACASFDLFKNYVDRGNQFREAVQALLPDQQPEKH